MSHARAKDSEMQSKKRAAEEEIPRELRDLKKTYLKPPEILLNDPNVKVISYASKSRGVPNPKKIQNENSWLIILGLGKIRLCSDPIHDVKNLVNGVREKPITLDGEKVSIQNTLWPLLQGHQSLRMMITDKDLFPTDKMDQRPIILLFKLLEEAEKIATQTNNKTAQSLCKYLSK